MKNERTITGTTIRLPAADTEVSEATLRDALTANPDDVNVLARLGLLLAESNRAAEALDFWRRAATLKPTAAYRYNLAELLRRLGRLMEAENEFQAVLALEPKCAEAHFGLANTYRVTGNAAKSLASYNRVLELAPSMARAWYNRGNLLREEGRVAEADADYQRALKVDPGFTDVLVNRGVALGELHRWNEAEAYYRKALQKRPNDADLMLSLAGSLLSQGRTAEGAEFIRAAEPHASDPSILKFRRETLVPPVAESVGTMSTSMERLSKILHLAASAPLRLDLPRLHQLSLEPPMALAYQAADPRPLLEAYTALYAPQIIPLEPILPSGERVRVGVVVTHGHEGVYDRCLGRLVECIGGRGEISVTLVCSQAGVNILRHLRPSFPSDYLVLPTRVDEAAARIHAAKFDVLHYWEVGTDSANYFLPFFRPARVQCATWGWPVTTGNSRVDWYVSSVGLEPKGAETHYIETLVRLPSLPTCYERPPAPTSPARPSDRRKAFNVDSKTAVYLCGQNMRKLHPEFDAVLAALLVADKRGRIVLVADEQPTITATVMNRLRKSLGASVTRVGVIGRLERAQYLRLVASADVLLDTRPYGAGANTMADAVACGTPVVTWPGEMHRGRWAAAVLRQAGAAELIVNSAAEYAEVAVRVANDEVFRKCMAKKLIDFGNGWFGNSKPAVELEEFWLASAAKR